MLYSNFEMPLLLFIEETLIIMKIVSRKYGLQNFKDLNCSLHFQAESQARRRVIGFIKRARNKSKTSEKRLPGTYPDIMRTTSQLTGG